MTGKRIRKTERDPGRARGRSFQRGWWLLLLCGILVFACGAGKKEEPPKKIVVLDPGHAAVTTGEYVPVGPGSEEMKLGDSGGTYGQASGQAECELTMQVAEKLRGELVARGYIVLLTHEDVNTAINNDDRAMIANKAGADCFLRIHADGSEDPSASGALAICITPANPWTAENYEESRRLSDCVLESYCEATGLPDRGVLEEDNMTGNNWAEMPAALLELGFMTNPSEDLMMADSDFQKTMVRGIADGIDRFFAEKAQRLTAEAAEQTAGDTTAEQGQEEAADAA